MVCAVARCLLKPSTMRNFRQLLWAALMLAATGCGDSGSMMMDPGGGGTTDPNANGATGGTGGSTAAGAGPMVIMISVAGNVLDFESTMPLASAEVTATGVTPIPQVTMTGGQFMLTNVQPFSVFYLTATSPPDYLTTNEAALKVDGSDVTGVQAYAVKGTYLAGLENAFNAQTTTGNGVLLAQVLDGNGAPQANVPKSALMLMGAAGAKGPFFLDAKKAAAPGLNATSASGWAVWFNVPPGPATLVTSAAGYSIDGAAAPIAAGVATLAAVRALTGAMKPPPPSGTISFATNVVPIFTKRGCVNCHSGDNAGADQGGLALNGSVSRIYANVVTDISPNWNITRVNLTTPAQSLVLEMPSYQPPHPHPTVVFPTSADPDYQTILAWITQGAKNN
jgi:hypothetical protein